MNCKPPCLAFIVREDAGMHENIGAIVRVIDADLCDPGEWRCECDHKAILSIDVENKVIKRLAIGQEFWIDDSYLKPINDQPGNEQFVTELRNKLPRSKPATTKQDTINERGELA